jgi:hypothetical protein
MVVVDAPVKATARDNPALSCYARSNLQPNGSGMSRAAVIDREYNRADSSLQNRHDLARRLAASAPCPCWAAAH